MSSAGEFRIEVGGPYPCWVRIVYCQQEIHGIHHGELKDLQFALDRAMAEARRKLGKDASELD
jgi:hypothetical protein